MSNNSYPCRSGGEIGRSQAAQAWACGLEPEPEMNPILLKPNSDGGSQIIINGHMWKNLSSREYYEHCDELRAVVIEAYEKLASRFEVVVIEGAGSVTELNLRRFDLANLSLATSISAPWLLVSDIERGGVFGSVIGTVHLLTAEERSLLRAFAVNRFRGDRSLFDDGRRILEERTGCPCLGVFPFASDIYLDEEDSLSVAHKPTALSSPNGQRCAILRFPRVSNTTDFSRLSNARWISSPVDEKFDFIFLPGTKNTIEDLKWLRLRRLDEWLQTQYDSGCTLIGICGGFQMLGLEIRDPFCMESDEKEIAGLGFLPVKTVLGQHKTTRVVRARSAKGHSFAAYEIHLGETAYQGGKFVPFATLDDNSEDGARGDRIIGTYLHGAFEDTNVLAELGIAARPRGNGGLERLGDWFAPFATRFEELFL
jgi:adenosylcobyric acid synthase